MTTVRIIDVTGQPSGWDIADALESGWTTKQTVQFAKDRVRPWVPADPKPAKKPRANGATPPNGNHAAVAAAAPPADPIQTPRQLTRAEVIPAARTSDIDTESPPASYALYNQLGLVLVRGHPHPNLNNATAVLERHPEITGRFWYDEFLRRVKSTWGCPPGESKEWGDSDSITLTLWMQRVLGIQKLAVATVEQAVVAYAYSRQRNECKDWLTSLKWDGTERVRQLMHIGFGAKPGAYTEAVAIYFMAGMANRILHPGCQVDSIPVFEGPEGRMKSSALRALGGDYFAESRENIFNKDFCLALQGKMLVEITEMHSFTGSAASVDATKGVISCRVDRYRPPYGRTAADHPRMNVFAGSTNRDNWNASDTGARRFLPIKCGNIDLAWITSNREQLFAEAVHITLAQPLWWNVSSGDAKIEQDARRNQDAWESNVATWLTGKDRVKSGEVLSDCLKIELGRQSESDQNRVCRILRALGWDSKVRRIGTRTERFWIAPQPEPENGAF